MLHPTQEDINDAIVALIREGVVVAFKDDVGKVRLASSTWAQSHLPSNVAMSADDAVAALADAEPTWMARWN